MKLIYSELCTFFDNFVRNIEHDRRRTSTRDVRVFLKGSLPRDQKGSQTIKVALTFSFGTWA